MLLLMLPLVSLASVPAFAQEPGAADPVTPGRLTLLPDDELAVRSFSVSSTQSPAEEILPGPDYSPTVGPSANPLALGYTPRNEEGILADRATARGRFVVPERDALV